MLASLGQLQLQGAATRASDVAPRQESMTESADNEPVISLLNDSRDEVSARIYAELVEGLWNPKSPPTIQRQVGMESISRELQPAIIKSLVWEVFDNIEDRGEAIATSYEGTFHWVFENEPPMRDGRALWSSFPTWLESNTDPLYWITGKPGSGKSTLMKFILRSGILEAQLRNWAGSCSPRIASFYAWVAGSDLQKSHLGFMRTILFQCLQADPEMVKPVAPRRWSLLNTLRSVKKQPPWEEWEIKECFNNLITEYGKSSSKKLVIFVDGLDEFEHKPAETLELIHDISQRGIKLCLASRQWTEFNDNLDKYPKLRIQDLTEKDMFRFVRGSLEANRGFSDLSMVFPLEARLLVQETVGKSSGVFLWSSLVIRKLLQSLSAGDRLPHLKKILDDLPDDLEQLFSRLWDSVEGPKSESAELIALKNAAYPELNYLTLWLAHGGIEEGLQIADLSDSHKSGLRSIIIRRLDSRTRGLLELSQKGNVEFIHRTAADWVVHQDVWAKISSYLTKDFDPCIRLLRAEVLRFTERLNDSWYRNNPQEKIEGEMHWVLRYAFRVTSSASETPRTELVKALDRMNYCVGEQASKSLNGARWRYRSTDGFVCNFFGLITRYCCIPYLDATFQSAPQRVPDSALKEAIFGHELTLPAAGVPLELRLKTVAFLLEKGIALGPLDDNGRKKVQARADPASTTYDRKEKIYWEGVETLLLANEPQDDRQFKQLRFTRRKEDVRNQNHGRKKKDTAVSASKADNGVGKKKGRLSFLKLF